MCRSLFNKGIECSSLKWNGATGNMATATAQTSFLTPAQVESFCKLKDSGKGKHQSSQFERVTTVATGFDVLWNDKTNSPDQIFFGCWGKEGGNGNFGSVASDETLSQALEGAYPGSVSFLPSEWQHPETIQSQRNAARTTFSLGAAVIMLVIILAGATRKSRLRSLHSNDVSGSPAYYELPTIEYIR